MHSIKLSDYQGHALIEEMGRVARNISADVANAVENQKKRLLALNEQLAEAQRVARAAAEQGDRSENAELQTAYDEISQLTIQISSYSVNIEAFERLKDVETSSTVSSALCAVGSVVCITDDLNPFGSAWIIKLYPAGLGNAKIGAIAMNTPLGRALSGHCKGESVVVRAPTRAITYHIKEVI